MTKKIKKKLPANKKLPDNVILLPRLEAMEGAMAGIFGRGKGRAIDKAQEIMYDAWDAPTSARAIALAREALDVSPDCADAYVLLARETARSLDKEIDLYRKGMEAGERALGKASFKQNAGHFWGILETRPYMRARAGLAECLWESGQHEEAVEHYQDMLRLNPNDNQGLRYILMTHLIELGFDERAEELFAQYGNDGFASWMYSRVLLDFRKKESLPAASKSLKVAIKVNKHVSAYLLGHRKMPRSMPPHYSPGSEYEAIICVNESKAAWKATPGALEWLAEHT